MIRRLPRRARRPLSALVLASLAGCSGNGPAPTAAMPFGDPSARASIGALTLQATPVRLSSLNTAMAQRYGIREGDEGGLLLVMLRDRNGNAIAPGDLQLSATAQVLPDPPQALALKRIEVDGMIDYIGVVTAAAPATLAFKLDARQGSAKVEIATTLDLQP